MSTNKLYLHPRYYDIAFDFRNLKKEQHFLREVYKKAKGRYPRSFVDIACGPAYHAIDFSKRDDIKVSYGLDLSPQMVEYAREKNDRLGGTAKILKGDMINFNLPQKVDLAVCMIASIHMLTTNDELLKHLNAVARNLTPGGIYVIEFQHPRDNYQSDGDDSPEWEMENNGTKVMVEWGSDDDPWDPIAQVHQTKVTMRVRENGSRHKFVFTDPYRIIPYQELMLMIQLNGKFKYAGSYGKFDLRKKLDNSDSSWRMISVLQKK